MIMYDISFLAQLNCCYYDCNAFQKIFIFKTKKTCNILGKEKENRTQSCQPADKNSSSLAVYVAPKPQKFDKCSFEYQKINCLFVFLILAA